MKPLKQFGNIWQVSNQSDFMLTAVSQDQEVKGASSFVSDVSVVASQESLKCADANLVPSWQNKMARDKFLFSFNCEIGPFYHKAVEKF